jgi:hypothetical protein
MPDTTTPVVPAKHRSKSAAIVPKSPTHAAAHWPHTAKSGDPKFLVAIQFAKTFPFPLHFDKSDTKPPVEVQGVMRTSLSRKPVTTKGHHL